MIFVFGSNAAGIHGAGAAAFAYKKKNARWGFSYGHIGDSFAIPTKGFKINHHARGGTVSVGDTLCLNQIRRYVDGFLAFAQDHPELKFQITAIGCGLAGLKHEDIAPMFDEATPNCFFDTLWQPYLKGDHQYWGTF